MLAETGVDCASLLVCGAVAWTIFASVFFSADIDSAGILEATEGVGFIPVITI